MNNIILNELPCKHKINTNIYQETPITKVRFCALTLLHWLAHIQAIWKTTELATAPGTCEIALKCPHCHKMEIIKSQKCIVLAHSVLQQVDIAQVSGKLSVRKSYSYTEAETIVNKKKQ